MSPAYLVVDCLPAAGGSWKVTDVRGGSAALWDLLPGAYGGQSAARARLRPFLERLGQLADGRLILFLQDPFHAAPTFPDDFFHLAQRYSAYCPITDWVSDLEALRRRSNGHETPSDALPSLLEPLAGRLRVRLGFCTAGRVNVYEGQPKLLLTGYRDRVRARPNSVILQPEEVGALVFLGPTERLPADLEAEDWFPLVNPPLLDRLLDDRWLLHLLLEGTPAAQLLPRTVPAGMGTCTADEVRGFGDSLAAPSGFPLAVLKPAHARLGSTVRYLDRTGLRALAARQPQRRVSYRLAQELEQPRVSHSYEEIAAYRGKLLDNLLRTPGAEVHDHGDGTFHFSAPYPFLESTVAALEEYVEPRPLRSRRTGKLHRGHCRALLFGGELLAAVYHLDKDQDDGTFRDLCGPAVRVFHEAPGPDDEAALREALGGFARELERQFEARVHSPADLDSLRDQWLRRHTASG